MRVSGGASGAVTISTTGARRVSLIESGLLRSRIRARKPRARRENSPPGPAASRLRADHAEPAVGRPLVHTNVGESGLREEIAVLLDRPDMHACQPQAIAVPGIAAAVVELRDDRQ